MDADVFEAKRKSERSGGDQDTFLNLVYNEQHAPAASGSVPEAGTMTSTISLVSAVKG